MTLLDSVMTSITDPYGTMEHLLHERKVPPFIISTFLVLLLVFVAPPLIFQYSYGLQPVSAASSYALTLVLSITFVFFVLFTIILLRLLGVTAPAIKVLASAVYSLTPFIPLMVGYYLANYVAIGHFSVNTYFITGRRAHGDWFLSFLPSFMQLGLFFSYVIFSCAIRIIGKMGMITGLTVGALSIPLLLGAFFIGATCSEAIFPESARTVTSWIGMYLQVPG